MNWIFPLFKLSFWFNIQAMPFMPWLGRFLPFFMGVVFVAGIGVVVYVRKTKVEKDVRRLWKSVGSCVGWAGAAGLILWFFQWQEVPFLTMRILWLFWIGGFGYWGYDIWNEHVRILPAQKAKDQARAEYEKWLPKHGGRK